MRLRALAFISLTTAGLLACGLDTNQQDQFEDKSKTKAAEKNREADAAGSRKESKSDLDCSEITLHGSHLTCDQDDISARDQNNSGSNEPAKKDDASADSKNDAPSGDETDGAIGEDDIEAPSEPAKPDTDSNVIVFRIKAGTGNGGWNTQADMIEAKIGQVIRVYNDDTIVHRLHTSGRPCPHGVNIPVGESRDCVVSQTFDSTTSNAVYDHIAGPSSKIWIRATN